MPQPKDAAGMTGEIAKQIDVVIGIAARLQADPAYLAELAYIEAGTGPGHPPTMQSAINHLHAALADVQTIAAALAAPRTP